MSKGARHATKLILNHPFVETVIVKLDYNKLGYNKHPVIMNKMNSIGWFQSFLWQYLSVITNKTRFY